MGSCASSILVPSRCRRPAPKIVHYIALDHIYFGPDFNLRKNFDIAFRFMRLCGRFRTRNKHKMLTFIPATV
jgi:hypothetical protein